jgi:hypothetical protein
MVRPSLIGRHLTVRRRVRSEAIGVGVTRGLGRSEIVVPEVLLLELARLPMTASAVPHPAIRTIRATTPAMISIHGVRCTAAPGALGV